MNWGKNAAMKIKLLGLKMVVTKPWTNRFVLETDEVSTSTGSLALSHCLMPR